MQQAYDEVQRLREQVQTQQEELRFAYEELQSTHEELTATKGEMQSLDDELQTVNIELQHKVYDLLTLKSDMNNLLDSTGIATIFLDNALKVRRFTPQATKIFKLFPGDVGRPLSFGNVSNDHAGWLTIGKWAADAIHQLGLQAPVSVSQPR